MRSSGPTRSGSKDLNKAYTFQEWNERSCRLANALADLGMKKGDSFAALAYNCVEWMEIYTAAAKGGFVCVPIMFRLSAPEMEYIVDHCEAKVFIVQDRVGRTRERHEEEPAYRRELHLLCRGQPAFDGYLSYEEVLAQCASPEEPAAQVNADDIWVIMYTGGTTGKPKGVMKSHASLFAQYFITIFDHQFNFDDVNLLVMPCCHVNSLFYSYVATWVGGTVMCYNMVSFNPENLLKTFSDHKVTFTSLVPTHYIMMLALPDEVKKKYDLSTVKKLLISSAPARKDTKLGSPRDVQEFASSMRPTDRREAGIVTILKPHEQLTKLGSCGREVIGSDVIRFYDEDGNLVTEPNRWASSTPEARCSSRATGRTLRRRPPP